MSAYEYKVVPAPARAEKLKGVSAPEQRFAVSVEKLMNHYAAEGWEYLRAETMPSEERKGLAGRTTQMRTLLVFRRPAAAQGRPASAASPGAPAPASAPSTPGERPALRPVSGEAAQPPGAPPADAAQDDGEEPIAIPGVLRAERGHDDRGIADKSAGRRLWAVRRDEEQS
jgi:hypothetical protein